MRSRLSLRSRGQVQSLLRRGFFLDELIFVSSRKARRRRRRKRGKTKWKPAARLDKQTKVWTGLPKRSTKQASTGGVVVAGRALWFLRWRASFFIPVVCGIDPGLEARTGPSTHAASASPRETRAEQEDKNWTLRLCVGEKAREPISRGRRTNPGDSADAG